MDKILRSVPPLRMTMVNGAERRKEWRLRRHSFLATDCHPERSEGSLQKKKAQKKETTKTNIHNLMKTHLKTLIAILLAIGIMLACKKDEIIRLQPLAGITLKVKTCEKATLPDDFTAQVSVMSGETVVKTEPVEFRRNAEVYVAQGLLEVPLNTPIYLKIVVSVDGGHWEGQTGEVTLTGSGGPETLDAVLRQTLLEDPIIGRWKDINLWIDRCNDDSEIIQGFTYLEFRTNQEVYYETILEGETYGCVGGDGVIGTWSNSNGTYILEWIEVAGGGSSEITISGNQFCLPGGDFDCFYRENTTMPPTVIMNSVENITASTATVHYRVYIDGGAAVTARGVVWGTMAEPDLGNNHGMNNDGTGIGTFTSNITDLLPATTYHVRVYATNSIGTSYTYQTMFQTQASGPVYGAGVTDIDGNVYQSVIIGTQEWMAKNLMVTRYNNGDAIPTGLDNTQWSEATTGAYAIYPFTSIEGLNSDAEVLAVYGALYNWFTVNTGILCPTGWHVPTDAELTQLTDFLGGESVAGGKLKSTRTAPDAHPRWESLNTGATDEYGFSALPGSFRDGGNGLMNNIGIEGIWWSSTPFNGGDNWRRTITYTSNSITSDYRSWQYGFSVRCLKN
jgi:uncharacterized protein (TIGR02145 family)